MNTPTPASDRVVFTEGSVALPPGFEDRTTNIFVPTNTQTQPNLSIARDWLQPGEALPSYLQRQLAQLQSRLSGYRVLSQGTLSLGPHAQGAKGLRIDATYKNGKVAVWQRQAVFLFKPQRAVIFTASSPRAFNDEFEALWGAWLASYTPPPHPDGDAGLGGDTPPSPEPAA